MDLFNKSTSIEFYNERYKKGYMEEWPAEKKMRVAKLIKEMNLPETGEALEYGCGNGVFTAIIKEVLPKWNVYGSDISEVAIENAKTRYTNCTFFLAEDPKWNEKKFDFILSHHVLEHVYDIEKSCQEISNLAKTHAHMLHMLPCGNENSLEYKICMKREDGINKEIQNRFFYEDPGHVRRLKSKELNSLFSKHKFKIIGAHYANQYYGALDWITEYDDEFINKLTELKKSKNLLNSVNLLLLRIKLLILYKAKHIKKFYENKTLKGNTFSKKIKYPWLITKLFFSKAIANYYKKKTEDEWANKSRTDNGSEMFLIFER